MERLTYRDDNGRALLTHFGQQMYCSTQATADCVCMLEERLEEAISLLKEQEPRVMTQEEAISDYTGVVYYESIYSSIVLAGYMVSIRDGRCEFATIGSEETEKEMLSDYGIKWRCWTSWPTDEQRRAVKWE